MKEQKKSPWHVLGNLDLYFMVILLACLIVLTVGGVLKRYILRNPISWLEEIQALLFGMPPMCLLKSWWIPCPKRLAA